MLLDELRRLLYNMTNVEHDIRIRYSCVVAELCNEQVCVKCEEYVSIEDTKKYGWMHVNVQDSRVMLNLIPVYTCHIYPRWIMWAPKVRAFKSK